MNDKEIKAKMTASWDHGAQEYDTFVSHGIKMKEEKELWIKEFSAVLPTKPLKVLDVGCGTGAMGLLLSEMGHDVSGVDLSEGMMEVGRKKAAVQNLSMTFTNEDAEDVPFEDETFDVVVNRHLLWTLPHPDKALASWRRVLKPDGHLLVIDGVWDNGSTISRVRRSLSMSIAMRVDKNPHGSHGYQEDVKQYLPNRGGMPKEKVVDSFMAAGFDVLDIRMLTDIAKCQKMQLPWYQKIAPKDVYYMAVGRKR